MSKNKVIVIVGPTASGKSGLGVELAKKINGEIISADSMQIYKNLDVGTAKVTTSEMQGVKHHMLDLIDITSTYSVADYKKECYLKIEDILKREKVPIIVGGTGLYINAVVNNLQFIEENEENVNEYLKQYEDKSLEELVDILKSQSIELYNSIDLKNRRRVERALYKTMTNSQDTTSLWQYNGSKYEFLVFYIDIPRELLYDRINLRIDHMIKDGILEEAEYLYNNISIASSTAVQAIGYKEFFPYFLGKATLDECIDNLKIATRHYAKRQITWFKKLQPKIHLDGTSNISDMCKIILGEYYGKE